MKPESFVGIGLIIISLSILAKYISDLPDYITGFGIVIGIVFEFVGAYLSRKRKLR